nr:unnamed protein product [Callosobruchus chinensis]
MLFKLSFGLHMQT